MAGLTPKNGRVADPGFRSVAPGSGEIRMPPVSVCHQVSTMGQRPSPTTRGYHSQASGLMGSPTEPNSRRVFREHVFTGASPSRMSDRIAVGDEYIIVTLCLSTICQNRLTVGEFGPPSNMAVVSPLSSGPYTI